MTERLGPYGLSATVGTELQVQWGAVSQPPIGIELENISGILLEVAVAGQQYWLSPWTARYFPVPSNAIGVDLVSDGELAPSQADPMRLLATLYQQGDTAPSLTPRPLSSLSLLAGISGDVTLANGTVIDLATGTAVNIAGTANVNVSNDPIFRLNQSLAASGTWTYNVPSGNQTSVIEQVDITPDSTTRSVALAFNPSGLTPGEWQAYCVGKTDGFVYDNVAVNNNQISGNGNTIYLACPGSADPLGYTIRLAALTITGPGTITVPYKIIADNQEPPIAKLVDSIGDDFGISGNPLTVRPDITTLFKVTQQKQTSESNVVQLGALVTGATFLNGPASGYNRIIEWIYTTASGAVYLGLNGSIPALRLVSNSPITPGWVLTSTLLYTLQTSTGGALYATYHDEPQ